jgi:CheY-like chemotaxis protein
MTDSPLSGRRVLVIEDEMMVAMLLKDFLANLGCTVVGSAVRVEQALAMIEAAGALDAAVLDINLNGQKSYPVADALAARSVPFVFATGYGLDSLINGYRRVPLLQKPFKLSKLSDALVKLLTQKEPTTLPGPRLN